jgi:hypothetical protein
MAGRKILFATILLPDEDGFYHPEQKTANCSYGDHAVKLANLIGVTGIVDLPVKGCQAYIEQAGCFDLISPGVGQHFLKVAFFHVLQIKGRLDIQGVVLKIPDLKREIFFREHVAFRHNDGPFNDVL